MDDFLEPFLSSSSWANMNTSGTGRTSWTGAVVSQTDSLLADSVGAYNGDEKSPPIRMISSGHITRNIAAEEPNLHAHDDASSIFIGENLKYGISNGLFHGEDQPPHEVPSPISLSSRHDNGIHESSFSLQGVIRSNSTSGSFDPELNTSRSVTLPYSALTESGSIKNNGSEASGFPHSLGDSHSVSSGPPMWPCSGVTSMVMGQGKLQGFGMQGLETDSNLVGDGNLEQLDSLTAVSVHEHNKLRNSHLPSFTAGQQINLTRTVGLQPHQQEQVELHNPHLPSFVAGSQMTMTRDAGIPTRQQLLQSSEGNVIKHYTNHSPFTQSQPAPINSGACNGSMKPRVRARRGQATDPHSIAERLRREKIAERMKNLQELVPNSNKLMKESLFRNLVDSKLNIASQFFWDPSIISKSRILCASKISFSDETDKASMLDEIIDYVKFLQLQVKVLSMSRLGAAGAVVPLITESQSEGSSSLLSPPVGQGGGDLSESQDTIAFEQEIVKLMESSVTTAMQFLQNKGLCLMPIALASAISSRKASSSAIYFEGRKPDVNSAQNSQGMMERSGREVGLNGCNGTIVKQEEAQKSVSSMRELKPNA